MTKGIQYAIAAVQDILLAQSGVRYAPDNPKDLAGTVDSIEQIRIAGYGPWQINGMPRYGWAFEIDVRITAC